MFSKSVLGVTRGSKKVTWDFLVGISTTRLKLATVWLTLFAILTFMVVNGWLRPFDTALENSIVSSQNPVADFVMNFSDMFGRNLVILSLPIIVGAGLLWKRQFKAAYYLAQSSGVGIFLTLTLKPLFNQVRPGVSASENLFCYPSGHTLSSMCLYGGLLIIGNSYIRNPVLKFFWQMSVSGLILAIGFSRIYFATHYPSDVVASLFVGAIYFSLTSGFMKKNQ